MFRDPSYYCALRQDVLPLLKTYSAPKIWVAGCCTGEEAYSIAILLHEEGMLEQSLIYATDINPLVLKTAMQGIFPVARLQAYTQHYQAAGGKAAFSDYYHAAYGNAVFSRHLGRHIVFAEHSLTTDAVFSEMQFISCRNVLIYFKRELQQRTLGMFADALCHRGFLGLGSRETVGVSNSSSRFEPWVKTAKIYRKLIEFHPGSGFK
jgi:chemotaxis protein methyltransferase CheR